MEVYWGEAELNIYVSPWDKISFLMFVLVALAVTSTLLLASNIFQIKITAQEMAILLGGYLIRFIYVFSTPYFIRAYDWWGHEAYLDYVVQHLSLPNPHSDWESYQPPLYYCLLGGITKVTLTCGMPFEDRYMLWQAASLICSSGTLLAGLWISRLLYADSPNLRLYMLAVLGVAPALLLNASRVSNDILLNFLEFVWLGLLIQFWNNQRRCSWYALSFVVGLALLTKASALVLVPISLLGLILLPRSDPKRKLSLAFSLIVIVSILASVYYLPRALNESAVDSYIVGNINQLNPKGHIDGIFTKSLVFNPFKILRYPLFDPWGPRHEYFPEYFFKSMFFGEGNIGESYRWVARIFMAIALLLVPLFLCGLWSALKKPVGNDVPLLLTFFGVFVTQWGFVQIASYMSSQDFRYSVILLIPITYFFLLYAGKLPAKWSQLSLLGLQLLALNSAIYILEIAFEG